MNIESDASGGHAVAAPDSLAVCDRMHRPFYELPSECALARLNASTLLLIGRTDMYGCYQMQRAVRQRQAEIENPEFRSGSTSSCAESVREPYPLTSPQGPPAADLSR